MVFERDVMTLVRSELPETTFVIVAYRKPQGFQSLRRILLEGDTTIVRSMALAE